MGKQNRLWCRFSCRNEFNASQRCWRVWQGATLGVYQQLRLGTRRLWTEIYWTEFQLRVHWMPISNKIYLNLLVGRNGRVIMRVMPTQWRISDSRSNEHGVYNSSQIYLVDCNWNQTGGIEMKSSVCKNCSTDPRLEQKQRIWYSY